MTTATAEPLFLLQNVLPFECSTFPTGAVALEPDSKLTLDGYFQILHLDALASMEGESCRVGLSIRGTGLVNLRLVRVSAQPSETVLHINELHLGSTHTACVTIPKAKLRGVLKIEMQALSAVEISTLSWGVVTGSQFHEIPIQKVNLGIVCCTFNRQIEIVKTVGAVQRTEAYRAGTVDLLIVDNGSNLELPSELRDLRTHMFGQRNFGGAGGFTRGVIEASGLQHVTHILLMDDDIEVLPEMIDRVARWLALLPESEAIAGAMLDSVKKTNLHEAGATFISKIIQIVPEYSDISLQLSSLALNKLAKPSAPDFGAWWFFAFSKKALAASGLPLPVFIRGDDIEFGIRLKKLGYRTHVIHGVAVWHEPFYLKRSTWPMYYAIRNLSIINAVHFPIKGSGYLLMLAKMFTQFAMRFDYGSAAAIQLGLNDFLKGPSLLREPGDATHQRVSKYLAVFGQKILKEDDAAKLNFEELSPPGSAEKISHALSIGGHLAPTILPKRPQLIKNDYASWRWLRRDQYGQYFAAAKLTQVYTKSPQYFWILCARMTATLINGLFNFEKCRREYKRQMPQLTSEQDWRTYLGIQKVSQ